MLLYKRRLGRFVIDSTAWELLLSCHALNADDGQPRNEAFNDEIGNQKESEISVQLLT